MKTKLLAFVLCLSFALTFFSCSRERSETTAANEPETAQNTTRAPAASVTEMSPERYDTALPAEAESRLILPEISDLEEISAEESMFKKSQASRILKDGPAEYYFSDSGKKVLLLIAGEDGEPRYTGSYGTESKRLEFFGDSDTSWYLDGSGELSCVVYTYRPASGAAPIITYYTPDGDRDFVQAAGEYYNGELDVLSETEATPYVVKYAGTAELIR